MSDVQQIGDLRVNDVIVVHRESAKDGPNAYTAKVIDVTARRAKLIVLETPDPATNPKMNETWVKGTPKIVDQHNLNEGYVYEVIDHVDVVELHDQQYERVRDIVAHELNFQVVEDRALILAIDPGYQLPPIYDCFLERCAFSMQLGKIMGVRTGPQQVLHNAKVVAWGFWPNGEDDTFSVLVMLNEHARRVADRASNSDHPLNYATFLWHIESSGVYETELFSNIVPAVEDYRNNKGMDY